MTDEARSDARDPSAVEEPATQSEAVGSSGPWEQLGTLLIAVLIAFGIRVFLVEPFRIPSGSMLPTLLIGDHLFVNKFVYGAKLPFGDWRLPGLREPERGEVVVFSVAKDGSETHPADTRLDLPREEFVKRLIGIPGDTIDIRDDVVFVNGEPTATEDLGLHFDDDFGRELDVRRVSLDRRRFRVLDDPRVRTRSGSFTVEEGRYFMLGDNRDYSKDSRIWGTVRLAEIKGPAFLLYWSWDFTGSWFDLLNPATWWEAEMRWERLGARVQ